jgi:hypothetical protein
MDLNEQETAHLVSQGIEALVGGFSITVSTLFEKPLIVSNEQNAFAELPKAIQITIVRNALQVVLAQTLASVAIIADGQISDKEVFSSGSAVLKRYYTDYLKEMRAHLNENPMDKGPEVENTSSGLILGPGDQGA